MKLLVALAAIALLIAIFAPEWVGPIVGTFHHAWDVWTQGVTP